MVPSKLFATDSLKTRKLGIFSTASHRCKITSRDEESHNSCRWFQMLQHGTWLPCLFLHVWMRSWRPISKRHPDLVLYSSIDQIHPRLLKPMELQHGRIWPTVCIAVSLLSRALSILPLYSVTGMTQCGCNQTRNYFQTTPTLLY